MVPTEHQPLRRPLDARIPFCLFFLSGFCTLVYQIVWLRLAFAAFGVVTPVLSVVISVFMLGLAIGTWAAGRWGEPLTKRTRVSAVFYYGLAELLIGLGAFLVPRAFAWGQAYLAGFGSADSSRYLLLSSLFIAGALLPWCVLMGATLPLMLAFFRERGSAAQSGFSFLYLANVLGALFGALSTAAALVELLGFHNTLLVAACANGAIAVVSWALGSRHRRGAGAEPPARPARVGAGDPPTSPAFVCAVLFTTGCASMGLEVVWTRAFTPVLETTIYAFARLLAVYLLATWVGSCLYRADLARGRPHATANLLSALALFSLLPVVVSDPRQHAGAGLLLASIFPCCAALGYLTPKLIDQYSSGSPRKAGNAYALNIVGCIVGPLLAGYVLLPLAGVRFAMALLAVPFLVFYGACYAAPGRGANAGRALGAAAVVLLGIATFVSRSYEDGRFYGDNVVRRDHTATVIAYGQGMHKRMLVNGVGITSLTPITKVMAHLPLALHEQKPASALAICFGMGTTFRSLMSWDMRVTAVELVPSVVEVFPFYFGDAGALLRSPNARIVIDDGRRFLSRTGDTFDVVTIDPPPPVEAAGSSLLYSQEFYRALKGRLKPGGIVHQWFPGWQGPDSRRMLQAVLRSVGNEFPHVKVFHSVEGWGWHILASLTPMRTPSAAEMTARLPERAKADLVEWFGGRDVREVAARILQRETDVRRLMSPDERLVITDDRPYNEYFFLRRHWPGLLTGNTAQ